ncbi:MAG: phytoene desaturase family protein, partial [Janthinobacterium lividum]
MSKQHTDFDAVIVGSGPNGLAAAIELQQHGLSVLLLEGKAKIGGGLRTEELTLPGFKHDICSAIHPLAAGSPFFKTLPLEDFGLEYIYPPIAAAHPFDDGYAAALLGSAKQTAIKLGIDCKPYLKLLKPLERNFTKLAPDLLGPLHYPKYPVKFARFGLDAIPSALQMAKKFRTKEARGLWAGMAAHGIQPLSNWATSAVALVLLATGNTKGWPMTKGGSIKIADALAAYFISLGGKIETNFEVKSLQQLPSSKTVLFDITPKQLLKIAGHKF